MKALSRRLFLSGLASTLGASTALASGWLPLRNVIPNPIIPSEAIQVGSGNDLQLGGVNIEI